MLHAATPSRTYVDALGRPFLAIAHNKQGSTDELIATRTVLDIEGMPKSVIDPLDRTCQTYAWSIAGQLLAESNIDKGDRWSIATVLGEMLRRWDQRGQMFAADYDVLRRPTHLFLTVASTQTTLERRYYGDDAGVSAPQVDNLKGRPIAIYDGAGLQKLGPYDFKGNLRGGARKLTLLANASATPDWSALDGVTSAATAEGTTVVALLEPTEYVETRLYDALNRITQLVTHDTSEFTPTYNDAGLLEAVDVRIRGASVATSFVKNIDYDAKGQRTLIEYSKDGGDNAAFATAYTYDALTFRLKRLVTTRVSPSTTLQDLRYTFDAVGNIVRIKDEADQGPLFTNAVVLPENVYVYDAIYRLISASGREHKSLGDVQVDESDRPLQNLPHANDSTAVRAYEESYEYDVVGNILEMFHASGANTWTRSYDYGDGSTNRLAATSVPAPVNSVSYAHDLHGNMTMMPHMAAITYTPFDQMQTAEIATVDAYYVYDSSGQRVRKVVDTNSNLIKERIYLGGYEIYREWVSAAIDFERQTLHVTDGAQRIAMVETKTIEDGGGAGTPTPRLRFQLGNHLGSATLEVTETGAVISFEEYTPYGVTAYRSSNGGVDVSARRYRYTGKERDDETGLYYNGARYLAAWLGRWTSADPIGIGADGPGLYNYTRGSPVNYTDPSGTTGTPLASFPLAAFEAARTMGGGPTARAAPAQQPEVNDPPADEPALLEDGESTPTSTDLPAEVDIDLGSGMTPQETLHKIFTINPATGRAELAESSVSNEPRWSIRRSGGALSNTVERTIDQINTDGTDNKTSLVDLALSRLRSAATSYRGSPPPDFYATFGRGVIEDAFQLRPDNDFKAIELAESTFGRDVDVSPSAAPYHVWEAIMRTGDDTGWDKVQHFVRSATSQYLYGKYPTNTLQYGKEIFSDEIVGWFDGSDSFSGQDMLANNRGQAFGERLYEQRHPIRAGVADLLMMW